MFTPSKADSSDTAAPGTEGHQLIARTVERQIPVHHAGDTHGPQAIQLQALLGSHCRKNSCHALLNPVPCVTHLVGPHPVNEMVLPGEGRGCDGIPVIVDQDGLDTGRPELDAQRCPPFGHGVSLLVGVAFLHGVTFRCALTRSVLAVHVLVSLPEPVDHLVGQGFDRPELECRGLDRGSAVLADCEGAVLCHEDGR